MRPMFSYYGAKWRLSKYLPPPPNELTIVEPFAGSAGYSLRYGKGRNVLLIDRDPIIVAVWQFLISAKPSEILNLPDIQPGQKVDELNCHQEAKWLIGFWLNKGSAAPRNVLSSWSVKYRNQFWGEAIRIRISNQVPYLRQWKARTGGYEDADIGYACYHIDPPYETAGRFYTHGSSSLDYQKLGHWCRNLKGFVHVCENSGANWLPFRAFREVKATTKKKGAAAVSFEALWCNDRLRQQAFPFFNVATW